MARGMSMTQLLEGTTLPRKKTEDYGWISIHMPHNVGDVLRRVADRERRSISNTARVLIEEALRARGETIPDRPTGEPEPDE